MKCPMYKQTEERTADVGTRIVPANARKSGGAKGRGRGRGQSQAQRLAREDRNTVRKRSVKQYQWSTVGRDAFNVAQTSQYVNQYHSLTVAAVTATDSSGEKEGV